MKKILKTVFILSLMASAFGQVFGQMPDKHIEVFEDGSVKIERDSLPLNIYIGEGETLTATGSKYLLWSERDTTPEKHYEFPSYTLEIIGNERNKEIYYTDTVDAIILVSTNNLPVHTIEGKWIKYRWNRQWLMDWWSKPEDLDINFQSLDPSYYVWDYKTKK